MKYVLAAAATALLCIQACSVQTDAPEAPDDADTGADTMPMPQVIEQAVSDASRPEAERALDTMRHPAEVLVFAGVERGWRVADLSAGTGYYSRVLSTAVGENGHVYTQNPTWVAEQYTGTTDALTALAGERANITYVESPLADVDAAIEEPLDAAFMILFYHDMADVGTDRAAVNRSIFDALKPGGVFLVIDHQAPEGTGAAHASDLHRIESDVVLEEILAAGFVLDRESDALMNEADPLDISVFAPEVRRQTNRFVYLFRKPA